MPRGTAAAALLGVLLSACAVGQGTAASPHRSTASPSASPTSAPQPLPPTADGPPAPAASPPSSSPTPSELDRLVASTRAQEAPGSRVLASRMASAYATLRDPRQPAARRDAAARAIQLGSAQLLSTPAWRGAALAALHPGDAASLQASIDAGNELGAIGDPGDSLPHWRITPPPPVAALMADYHEAERAYSIPWQFLAAINLVETAMGRIQGLSVAGAQGPMQFMPQTWATYGRGDINDPRDSILAAARYLRARGGPQDMDTALYAYNQSHHYVRAIDIFAQQIATDQDGYRLFYSWQVLVPTTSGPALLPEGWSS